MKQAFLHCVAVEEIGSGKPTNHNKSYYMRQISADRFEVEFARIGKAPQKKFYPMSRWNEKYNEKTQKIRNGYIYVDVTEYMTTSQVNNEPLIQISDPLVARLIQVLSRYAQDSVAHDYLVKAENVTQIQVTRAQDLLDEISNIMTWPSQQAIASLSSLTDPSDIRNINKILLELYHVIPRRMDDVSDYLLKDSWSVGRINQFVEEEQQRLDVMAQQVTEINTEVKEGSSILDAMGISLAKADDAVLTEVMQHIHADEQIKVKNVYRVVNRKTQGEFEKLLLEINKNRIKKWHGSYNKNWLGIITEGLVIRKTRTNGRAFGDGLYFGSFFKSLMYTEGGRDGWQGYMALYDLNMGEVLEIKDRRGSWYSDIHKHLYRDGRQYHSVWAVAGGPVIYDEWIIYNRCQSTIYALVELG